MQTEQKTKTKTKIEQKNIVLCAQKTKYSLARIALLTTTLTAAGVAGRVAFQFIPSVEPLTPLAILIGFFIGPVAGFFSGASGFFASNFLVWGGQGYWTIFQCIGAGLAGIVGGLFGKFFKFNEKFFGKKIAKKELLVVFAATAIGITLYEIIVTLGTGAVMTLFNPALLLLYAVTSIPFSLVHITSSLGFATAFYEFKEQIKKMKGGKIIEREILGFRVFDGGNSNTGNRIVPYLYSRKTLGHDNSKHDSGFWSIKRKFEDDKDE
jgi:energy-coupling factor transport system substrate-specific component